MIALEIIHNMVSLRMLSHTAEMFAFCHPMGRNGYSTKNKHETWFVLWMGYFGAQITYHNCHVDTLARQIP